MFAEAAQKFIRRRGIVLATVLGLFSIGSSQALPIAPGYCPQFLLSPAEAQSAENDRRVENILEFLRQRLAFDRNPFLFEDERNFASIFHELKTSFPYLDLTMDEADRMIRESKALSPQFEAELLKRAEEVALRPQESQRRDQAVLQAVERLREMRRYSDALEEAAKEPAKTPEKSPEAKKPKDKPKPKDKEKKKKKPAKPEPPSAQENYRAHIKDFPDGENGESSERVSIASIDEPGIILFKTGTYGMVDGKTGIWAMTDVSPPKPIGTLSLTGARTLRVKPFASKGDRLPVLVPEGYVPVTRKDRTGEVWREGNGNYYYRSEMDEFEITVVPQKNVARPLNPMERKVYTQKSDVELQEWPELIQQSILELKTLDQQGVFNGPRRNVEIATLLTKIIKAKFIYAMDEREAMGAVEMAKEGAFQCDGAATIATTLLREHFEIPTRICSGLQGHRSSSHRGESHLIHPGIGHAWIEVADEDGLWHTLDPTPVKKERPEKSSGESDEWDPNTPKQDQDDQELSDSESKSSESDGDASEKGGESPGEIDALKKAIREIAEKKKQDADQRAAEKAGREGEKTGKDADKSKGDESEQADEAASSNRPDLPPMDVDQFLKNLERKPFLRDAAKSLMDWALDSRLPTTAKIERMSALRSRLKGSSDFGFSSFSHLVGVLDEAKFAFVHARPAFSTWASQIAKRAPEVPLMETADELSRLRIQLEFTLRFPMEAHRKALEALLSKILAAQNRLSKVRHKDSTAIQIAHEMFENLPGSISRKVLRDRYRLSGDLGADMGTLSLSNDISKGQLNDFRMMSVLGPHTQFLVDPIYRPTQGMARTWTRAYGSQQGRQQLIPTADMRDRRHWINLSPNLSDEQARQMGYLVVPGRYRRVPVPRGFESREPRAMTVVGVDVSGSMAGAPEEFQANFIRAMVDREVSRGNTLVVSAFGDDVVDTFYVRTREEAEDVVRSISKLRNRGSGTDIQKFLLHATELVDKARGEGNQALSRANIVLCSDGGSTVEHEVIKEALSRAKGNKTQVLMNFVAIGGTNPVLQELAEESGKLGADRGIYTHWSPEDMAKVKTTATSPPKPVSDFWSDVSFGSLPSEIRNSILALGAQGPLPQSVQDPQRWISRLENKLESSKRALKKGEDTPLYNKIEGLRVALNMLNDLLGPQDRLALLADIIRNHESEIIPSGRDYVDKELGVLTNLLRWAKGG